MRIAIFALAILATAGAAPPDPLPLRRLLISPERLPSELERARQGRLVQMSRDDFEARVAEAARAGEALKNPPRLVEARYRAQLIDTALVGTAQWTIVHSGTTAGILPLQPLNLALRQVRFDERDALLGDWDGKSLGLWVEQAGTHHISLSWSTRGDPGLAGLRFELKVPSCVLTTFELEVPADRTATVVGDNCVLSRLPPGSASEQRTWRLLCGGGTPVELLIRRTAEASESTPLVLARLQTTQRLTADLLQAHYDFNLEVLHGGIRELWCEGDAALHPTAVTAGSAEIQTWEVRPGPTPGAPFTLRIRLRQRFEGNLLPLRIQCLATAAPANRWKSPAMRLKGGVFQGETLLLQISPEVALEDWQPGGFELLKAAGEADGGQALTLRSGLGRNDARWGAMAARPSARLRVQEPEYRARQLAWWQIGPDTTSLTVQIDYEIVRGRLFRLPLVLPANWNLDRAELTPKDLLWDWTPLAAERGQTYLIVELHRALESPSTLRLTLQLHPANPWPVFTRDHQAKPSLFSVPFPEIVPQRSRLWDGALAIRVDPLYQTNVRTAAPAVTVGRTMEARGSGREEAESPRSMFLEPLASLLSHPPWGAQPPDFVYRFREKAASGTLELRPRPPRVRAHCTSEIVLAAGRAAVLTRLLLRPDVGSPDTIDFLVSAPVSGPWNWRSEGGRNAVKGMQRLPMREILPGLLPLGAGTPLAAAGLLNSPLARATWWRLTLEQPLREPLLLETSFDLTGEGPTRISASGVSTFAAGTALEALTLAAAGSEAGRMQAEERRWEIPLVTVVSAEPMDGEVQLDLAGTGVERIEPVGLREVAIRAGAGVSTAWRTFRYSRLPVALVLHGGIAAANRPAPAVVENAHLRTFVDPAGRLLNYYSFQVRNWKQRRLPLRLPAGAQILAAKVAGRWVAGPMAYETTADGLVAELPVATEAVAQCFEVAYALENRIGTLWTQVRAPVPVLPVAAVASRRTWCLPPGFVPLRVGLLQRPPGSVRDLDEPGEPGEPGASAPGGEALSRSWFRNPFAEPWRQRQEELLIKADASLREREGRDKHRTLGGALYFLTYERLKGQQILVLDAVALREAGLRPATRIPSEARNGQRTGPEGEALLRSLEGLDLICVPCRPAPVITTQRQWASWEHLLGGTQAVSDSLEPALSEAIAHGHDRSGRFRHAADWLRDGERECENRANGEPGEPGASAPGGSGVRAPVNPPGAHTPGSPLPHPEAWTEWDPVAGSPDEETLVVLRQDTLWGIAFPLTGWLLLAWWWARRRGGVWRYRLTLLWLAASILGLLWLPAALRTVFWWPLLAGIAAAGAWYLVSGLRFPTAAPSLPPNTVAAALLAVAVAIGWTAQAAAPPPLAPAGERGRGEGGPYTVWLLPGPADAPEKLQALVPPDLLTQLQLLARRGAAGLQGAFLLRAKYQGSIANGVADLEAEFQVHSFAEERTTLALPLGGVELREVFVDGSPAYPVALPAPQNGYAVRIQGRGAHTLQVRFAVRLTATGEDQDLRCTIPELAQSQLTLLAPEGARSLQAVFGRGAQHVSSGPKGVHLDAELGRVGTLHIHWRQEASQPTPAALEMKEVYYWDLQWSGSRLLALLDYTILRGAVTELAAGLPEGMEVRQVETLSSSSAGLGPRLKDWSLSGVGSQRRLRLEFQGPVTNNVQVLLELVSSRPLARRLVLSLPTFEGITHGEGFLAYRVQGLQDSVVDAHGVTGIEPAAFESHWQPAGTEYPGLPTRAYRFRRNAGAAPLLRLDLQAPARRVEGVQDITWYLGPQQGDVYAEAKLTAPQKDLAFVEWQIPPEVIVVDVRGSDVRDWSRTASRLQVWLQRSVAQTHLELVGWRTAPANQPMTAFRLPRLTLPAAAPHPTHVRMVAEQGWTLQAEQLQDLATLPESQSSDHDQRFVSRQGTYGGIFHLRPVTAHADVRTLSRVEAQDRQVAFHATLDYEISQRTPRTVTVRLHNWQGQEVHLEAPPTVKRGEPRQDSRARTWTLELPPDYAGRLQCQLTGTLAGEANTDVIVPEVSVDQATSSERWLAVLGQGLRTDEQRGLVSVADAAQALSPWPAAADRLRRFGGSVWKIDAPDWRLHLRTDLPLVESRPAQLILEEQAATIREDRRWLHEATYWLYQESGTYLGMVLPPGAALMTAWLDGKEVTPLQAGSERFWLPLTGGSGIRTLRLCWIFPADRERREQPRLERPRLENLLPPLAAPQDATLWTVHIPPGYRLADSGESARQGTLVDRELRCAAAQLQASQLLAEQAAGKTDEPHGRQLLMAQVRFYRHCRDADYPLAFPEKLWGIDRESLAARLRKLQADNQQLARRLHFEKIRAQAEAQAAAYPGSGTSPGGLEAERSQDAESADRLGQRGTPSYWQVSTDGGEPRVRLIAIQTEQTRRAFGYSGLLLVLFCVAWLLPLYPRAVAWLWASWPEQIAVLGGLVWLVLGRDWVGVLFLFLGVAVRLVYLGQWVVARLRRPAPAAGSGVTAAS